MIDIRERLAEVEAERDYLRAENRRLRRDETDWLRAFAMLLDKAAGGRATFTREMLVMYPRNRQVVIWDDPRTFTTVVETREVD